VDEKQQGCERLPPALQGLRLGWPNVPTPPPAAPPPVPRGPARGPPRPPDAIAPASSLRVKAAARPHELQKLAEDVFYFEKREEPPLGWLVFYF